MSKTPVQAATERRDHADSVARKARTEHDAATDRLQTLLRLTGPIGDDAVAPDPLQRAEARAALPEAEQTFHLAKAKLVQAERDHASAREVEREAILDARRPERVTLVTEFAKRVMAAAEVADRIRHFDEGTTIATGRQTEHPWPALCSGTPQCEGSTDRVERWRKEGWLG